MRRTEEAAAQTRQDILAAALLSFARRGYLACRLSDVAQAAGVTRGALYHHFADKETLFAAVLEHYWASLTLGAWERLDEDGPFERRLERFLDHWVADLRSDEQLRALLVLTFSVGGPTEQERAQKAQALRSWTARLEQHLSASGQPPWSTDAENLARHLVALLCGLFTLAALDPALLPSASAANLHPLVRPSHELPS